MKKRILFSILIVVLLFSVVAPAVNAKAAAGEVKLTVINKTKTDVPLRLSGAGSYTIDGHGAKFKVSVLPGTYSYSYKACGRTFYGTLVVAKGTKLVLPACPASDNSRELTSFTVQNNTNGLLTIVLKAKGITYTFTLGAGAQVVTVQKAQYKYAVKGCSGGAKKGIINLNGYLRTWTWTCNASKK
jgi:hypothetical protein